MIMYDNAVMVVRRKEPFVNWLRETIEKTGALSAHEFDDAMQTALQEVNPSCYLTPLFKTKSKADEYVKNNFDEIFKNEIAQWSIDTGYWPKDLTLKAFYEWFEIDFHSATIGMETH